MPWRKRCQFLIKIKVTVNYAKHLGLAAKLNHPKDEVYPQPHLATPKGCPWEGAWKHWEQVCRLCKTCHPGTAPVQGGAGSHSVLICLLPMQESYFPLQSNLDSVTFHVHSSCFS